MRRRVLGEFPLQGTAMNAEQPGSLRNVPLAIGDDALQVLPLDSGQRRNGGGRRLKLAGGGGAQLVVDRENLVGVGRLAWTMMPKAQESGDNTEIELIDCKTCTGFS